MLHHTWVVTIFITFFFSSSIQAKELHPLIFVHGRDGSSQNFASLQQATQALSQFQISFFSYDDLHSPLKQSAKKLAASLQKTSSSSVTVLAHSMGGLVAREALNILAKTKSLQELPEIRVITVDTPWHGGSMRFCRMKRTRIDQMISRILPAAIADMHSCSDFFQSIYSVPWPKKFRLEVYFAHEGSQALDYSETPLHEIAGKFANYFNKRTPLEGNYFEMNFAKALASSARYSEFTKEILASTKAAPIKADKVKKLLEKYFPHLPGNHVSVLNSDLLQKIILSSPAL